MKLLKFFAFGLAFSALVSFGSNFSRADHHDGHQAAGHEQHHENAAAPADHAAHGKEHHKKDKKNHVEHKKAHKAQKVNAGRAENEN